MKSPNFAPGLIPSILLNSIIFIFAVTKGELFHIKWIMRFYFLNKEQRGAYKNRKINQNFKMSNCYTFVLFLVCFCVPNRNAERIMSAVGMGEVLLLSLNLWYKIHFWVRIFSLYLHSDSKCEWDRTWQIKYLTKKKFSGWYVLSDPLQVFFCSHSHSIFVWLFFHC